MTPAALLVCKLSQIIKSPWYHFTVALTQFRC